MEEPTKDIEAQERALVARFVARDEAASAEFVRLYRDRLYRTAVAFLGWQDPEAEDAVQETLEAAFKGLSSFEFRSTIYTWLNQICVRACYRRIRARRRTVLGTAADLAQTLGQEAPAEDTPLHLEDAQRKAMLHKALQSLDASCREVVGMRDLSGESYATVSKALKLAMGTVMSRLARCREKLKKIMLKAERG